MKVITILFFFPYLLFCSSIKEFSLSTYPDFQKGKVEGLLCSEKGLSLGIYFEPKDIIPEESITSAYEKDEKIFLGGFPSGTIYKYEKEKLEEEGRIEGGLITSLLYFKNKIYVGTTSPARLYTLRENKPELLFEFEEKHIWEIVDIDNDIYIGTGEPAGIYRIRDGKREKILELKEEGVTAIHKGKDGKIYIGTYGKGFIISLTDGKTETLYNSNLLQISKFTEDLKGNLYFLSSSFPKLEEKEKKEITTAIGVYEKGRFKILKEIKEFFVNSFYYNRELEMLIYGGSDGKVYGLKDGKEALLFNSPHQEMEFIFKNYAISSKSIQIYHLIKAKKGIYLSDVFDPSRMAHWGNIFWNGMGNLKIYTRFGATKEIGENWSSFSEPCREKICKVDKISNYAQVKIEIEKEGILENFLWIVKPINMPPEIKSFKVSKPGEIFLKGPIPSENVVIEATNPDKYGIFTTIDFPPPEGKEKGFKKAYKKGFLTLSWEVSEPDGEEVEYSLFFKKEGEENWYEIFKEERITFFSFDTTSLPDGNYRFKLIARDLPEKETVEEISPITLIDNTPPEIKYEKEKEYYNINVKDFSRLIKAEYSCNARRWEKIEPEDKILDGAEENFKLKLNEKCNFLILRFMDSFYNLSTVLLK